MSVESASWVSELTAANPPGTDNVSQGDDHIRLMKAVLLATFPTASKAFYFPTYLDKTANFVVTSAQQNTHFGCNATSANITATLPSLAAGLIGWTIVVQKIDATSNTIAIAPPSGTINGGSSITLASQWDSATIRWTGSTWYATSIVAIVSPTVTNLALTAVNINGAAALTEIATGDYFPVYDVSAALNKKITALDILDVINALTEDTSPSAANDFVATWDASALEAKKVKLSNLVSVTVPSAATQAEMETGTSTAVYATPGVAKYAQGAAKAWAKIVVSGGVPSIANSYGVASITDTATGRLTINWSVPFSTIHYSVVATIERFSTASPTQAVRCDVCIRNGSQAVGSVQFECLDDDAPASFVDPSSYHIMAFGDI